MQTEINNAIEILKEGGVILYPTDTIWGIGCDATNIKAIEKIYRIKKRNDSKALISLVNNVNQLKKITSIQPKSINKLKNTTIIYPKVNIIAKNAKANDGSAGIRITSDKFCKKLVKIFNKPIISTSANISGKMYPKCFSEIEEEITKKVDYIVNLRKKELMDKASNIFLFKIDGKMIKIR